MPHRLGLTFCRIEGNHDCPQDDSLLHLKRNHIGGAIVPKVAAIVFSDLTVRDEKKVELLMVVNSQCDGYSLEGTSQPP